MSYKLLSGPQFKLKPVTAAKRNYDPNRPKKDGTLTTGIVRLVDEKYVVEIKINKDSPSTDRLYLDFTEESYELRGRVSVFSKTKDEHGNYVRYIRNESQCKYFPGSKENLVPFSPNWVINGYIVRKNGAPLEFDFNDIIAPEGYTPMIPENE